MRQGYIENISYGHGIRRKIKITGATNAREYHSWY